MNFFFLLGSEKINGHLRIPKFQNRGKFFDNNIQLYEYIIENNEWLIKEYQGKENNYFWEISTKKYNINSIFSIHNKKDLKFKNFKKLKKISNLTSTYPDFRGNNKVFIDKGGFSSYQSDYPFKMIERGGSILSPINVLLNKNADKNFVFFRNIFHLPIQEKFEIVLINIKSFKIIKRFECKTNQMNILNIDKEQIQGENYIFSKKYLGIPVFCSLYDGYISLEHTHPPHEYILSNDKFKTVSEIKKQIYEKVFK